MAKVCPECGRRYLDDSHLCSVDHTPLITSDDPFIGNVLSRYRLVRQIGKGGFGVVYLGKHEKLEGNTAAIKILRRKFITDDQLVGRFQREAEVCSQISHENVVQIIDYDYDDVLGFYYVMEFLDGVSLTEAMRSYPTGMPLQRLLPIMRQICAALQRAHALNIIHRDLKPSNILLIKRFTQVDIVKILDFGIAKVLQAEKGQNMTVTGQIVGSPRFMSPEQARGRHSEVDGRSDIYSLGVMVFWLLTGRLPFESKQLARLLYMHVKKEPPTLSSTGRAFSEGMEALIRSALAKDKEHRPASAEEFFRLFEAASHHESVSGSWDAANQVQNFQTQATPIPSRVPQPAVSTAYESSQSSFSSHNPPADTPSGMYYGTSGSFSSSPGQDLHNSAISELQRGAFDSEQPPTQASFHGHLEGAFGDDDGATHLNDASTKLDDAATSLNVSIPRSQLAESAFGDDDDELHTIIETVGSLENYAQERPQLDSNTMMLQRRRQQQSTAPQSMISGPHAHLSSKITPLPPLQQQDPSRQNVNAPASPASPVRTLLLALLIGILLGGCGLLGWHIYQKSQRQEHKALPMHQPLKPPMTSPQRPV